MWNIAKKYNISVDELKSANKLTNNMLSIGQKLVIPNTSEYKTYVVKSGDSLWKIANNFGVNLNDLISLNDLKRTNSFNSIIMYKKIPSGSRNLLFYKIQTCLNVFRFLGLNFFNVIVCILLDRVYRSNDFYIVLHFFDHTTKLDMD